MVGPSLDQRLKSGEVGLPILSLRVGTGQQKRVHPLERAARAGSNAASQELLRRRTKGKQDEPRLPGVKLPPQDIHASAEFASGDLGGSGRRTLDYVRQSMPSSLERLVLPICAVVLKASTLRRRAHTP